MPLTLAQMLALLPDNTAGDISAADARDVVTALHTAGAAVFADSVAAQAINSVTDVTVVTQNVTDIVAGDLLEVDIWGFVNNSTGGNRTVVLTLDFDAAFDMECSFLSVSQVQFVSMSARVAVISTSLATLNLTVIIPPQITVGTLTNVDGTSSLWTKAGYDTTTQDLTGTTAVALFARSDAATATQEFTPLGFTIRKLTST